MKCKVKKYQIFKNSINEFFAFLASLREILNFKTAFLNCIFGLIKKGLL